MMSRETIRSSCQIFEPIFEVFRPKAYYFSRLICIFTHGMPVWGKNN